MSWRFWARASGGRGVGEGVDGAAGELPRDAEDDAGDEDGGDGVGEFERGDVPVLAGVGCGQAEEDGEEDQMSVRKWMASASRASLLGLAGDAVEFAGAGEVDGDGEEKGDEGPDRELEGEVLAEERCGGRPR